MASKYRCAKSWIVLGTRPIGIIRTSDGRGYIQLTKDRPRKVQAAAHVALR